VGFVDDHAGGGYGQAVVPLLGEDFCALEECLGEADGSRVVVAGCLDGDDGESSFRGLKAEIGSVEVEAQVWVESQGRIPGHDQKELIECGDRCRQRRAFVKQAAAVDDPADAIGGEGSVVLNRWAYSVYSCDSDRAELSFCCLELLEQFVVPSGRQHDVLVEADDPVPFRAAYSEVQAVGCGLAVFDQDDLVGRIVTQAR
jgi:hypothetical protein